MSSSTILTSMLGVCSSSFARIALRIKSPFAAVRLSRYDFPAD